MDYGGYSNDEKQQETSHQAHILLHRSGHYGLWGEHHLKKVPVMENGRMIGIINVSNIIGYAVSLMEEPA